MTTFQLCDFGEIWRVFKGLETGDYEEWHNRWWNMAEYVEGLAKSDEQKGHLVSARKHYIRAYTYYRMCSLWLKFGEAREAHVFDKGLECYSKWAALSDPPVERVEIPFEGYTMQAWYMPPKVKRAAKSPAFIYFGAEAAGGEIMIVTGPPEACERGIGALLVDGPGQGTTLRHKKVYGRPDVEKPVAAMLDYLEKRPDVDPNRLGVFGSDMGGYTSVRAAAFDKRIKACGNITACYDLWTDLYEYGKENHRAALEAFLGTHDPDEVRKRLSAFTLKGVAEKVTCPVFISHAEETSVYPVEPAFRVYREVKGPKTLHILNTGHTTMERRAESVYEAMDWIVDQLFSV